MVQDFAQNYLCNLQNEPQAIHWLHKQATLHPTVVHYKCPVDDCHTVTHEVVHISNDLKHDAHLVEKFHQTTMKVLKDQNVEVRKIVKLCKVLFPVSLVVHKCIVQHWGMLRECILGSYRVLRFYQHKYN